MCCATCKYRQRDKLECIWAECECEHVFNLIKTINITKLLFHAEFSCSYYKKRTTMTYEEFIKILKEWIITDYTGDNAIQGLQIIAKYFDKTHTIIVGAEHDTIYSVDAEELFKRGITREDTENLSKLNWMIDDDMYLSCFV